MSGAFGSSQWMYSSGAAGFYPYSIGTALRFNDNDSAYLSRTPASAGNRKTWTWSAWVKRSSIDSANAYILFDASTSDTAAALIEFAKSTEGDNSLNVVSYQGSHNIRLRTSMRFRDVSSFYHIVVAVDTTQATSTDRVKIYVNGTLQTDFQIETYPAQNHEPYFNSTNQHHISKWHDNRRFFDGYMAEVNFIDGTALDATSFGETINGVWVPKAYDTADGAYGTNGFYLPFDDSSAIGDDESGNTNDWTANNLAASDVVPDSPTNNFATLNSAANFMPATLTEGNLKATPTSSSDKRYHSTFPISSGKWYCEIRIVSTGNRNHIGFWGTENTASTSVPTNYARLGVGNSSSATSGTFNGTAFTASAGDILTYAFDADDGKLYFGRNAAPTIGATADFTGLASDTYVLGQRETGTLNTTNHFNFGQDDTFAGAITAGGNADDNGIGTFKYAPPSGFLAMCSANLPEPTISPNSAEQADDYFNTVLYTGTGATQSITGVGFQPDWTWVKRRSGAQEPSVTDSVRGVNAQLRPASTAAESAQTDALTSFDADGFTLGADATNRSYNYYTDAHVAWNWKAGGTAVSNTNGSITSQVSAAPDAGMSIATWTGNQIAGATVGHGLSQAPEMYIVKARGAAASWAVYHSALGATKWLLVNSTQAATTSSQEWNNTEPTSTVVSLGTSSANSNQSTTYVGYFFHSVDGFSKVGSMELNNNADGTFVYLGFRPALVIAKRIDGIGDWNIFDSTRDAFNDGDLDLLQANTSFAESAFAASPIDLLSNGFKLRHTSANGYVNTATDTAIFYAVAEQPFKYSNAR